MLTDKRPTDLLKDEETREHIKELQESALGNIVQLEKAPTETSPLLEANTAGSFENDFYWRVGQVIYKFTSDEQITIT